MSYRILLSSLITMFAIALAAQLNVSYVGNITYNQDLSDIWGYVSPEGDEYAIVGVYDGVSVVDLSDPSNPTELFFFPGDNSTWRDIKTWAGYAYVTNETGSGLMVIDLTGLPSTASATDWEPIIPGEGQLTSLHNIWIDEFGYAYLAGASLNNGGMIYADVNTTPGTPIFAGLGPNIYSHDVFVRDNIMYSSEVYAGVFSIYDVTDKSNTITLGSQPTEAAFTHNAWLSDDSNILYTTDEVPDAPVGAYDVSDPTDVQELDQYRPFETLGEGVIPHNVHVWGDWLIVSYYTDGCIILDGSNPTNLVEVGNFDTFIPATTGFDGAWGAYPYLPSGLILISDIGNGMYVLQPNYVNACWLEGSVTDAVTGSGIVGATLSLQSTLITDESGAQGAYATGYAVAGTYDVLVESPGYASQTVPVELENGVITELDIALTPLTAMTAAGAVSDATTADGIASAVIHLESSQFSIDVLSNANGEINLDNIFPGTYQVTAGKWGWQTACQELTLDQQNNTFTIELSPGYADDFGVDLGWTSISSATSGDWVREEPIGTFQGQEPINPDTDVEGDCGGQAYVTGNAGGDIGTDDVDAGEVTLTSPEFIIADDATSVMLSYYRWFVNTGGQGTPNDLLEVYLISDTESYLLESIDQSNDFNSWEYISHELLDLPLEGNSYALQVVTGDGVGGHVVEAGFDQFMIESIVSGIGEELLVAELQIQPNPSVDQFQLSYDLAQYEIGTRLLVFDATGREVHREVLQVAQGQLSFGADLEAGVYFLQLQSPSGPLNAMKPLVKE